MADSKLTREEALSWHALDIAEVESILGTHVHGLSTPEVQRRRQVYGENKLADSEPISNLAILLAHFRSPLLTGVLTNEAEVYRTNDGYELTGDPTEAALLVAAEKAGIDTEDAREQYRTRAEIPFEPDRQYSASFREMDGQHYSFVKGAPERLLGMCTAMFGASGEEPLDADGIREAAAEMAQDGLRVLGMAYRRLEAPSDDPTGLSEIKGLTILGLEAMMDSPRHGVPDAIAGCRNAGIRVLMITGDHPATALAIGRDLGISAVAAGVVSGRQVDEMDEGELEQSVDQTSIFARVSPAHKLRIVRALQRRGEVVAVTGDGVNDAPALKVADIGVAMGRSGTDVAREAADMVLADDNFVSIYAAVGEGRIPSTTSAASPSFSSPLAPQQSSLSCLPSSSGGLCLYFLPSLYG